MTLQEQLPTNMYEWSKFFLIIAIIIACGMVIVNQFTSYYYKEKFLRTPCGLCADLNPQLAACFQATSTYIIKNNSDINYSVDFNKFSAALNK